MSKKITVLQNLILPVLPLRDIVIYPNMIIPLFVGREKSVKSVEMSISGGKQIFLLAQKDAKIEEPKVEDFFNIGVVGNVLQVMKLPDGTSKILVEGIHRAVVKKFFEKDGILWVDLEEFREIESKNAEDLPLIRLAIAKFEEFIKLGGKIPPEIISALHNITSAGRLSDTIAAHLPLNITEKQKLLSLEDSRLRLEEVVHFLNREFDVLEMQERLRKRVKGHLDKVQREYYLNEQLKAIQDEIKNLNEGKEPLMNEMDKISKKIEEAGLSVEAKEKALAEFNKLKMMPPMSAEATVSRNYLDWMLDLPWQKKTKVNKDLAKAGDVLDRDHYGLEKVKERILEYLAVQQRVDKLKGPILCLVGPPGVGKTSLGQSIAKATGREFVRVSLGGVRDEAEIRGHRRTYIGSMPGKILQKLAKIKVKNPLFMLDEVDKMTSDFRGDPSSALLEVLDPEQNSTFNDHYLEVDYDLSDVMFIATANSFDIPYPLLDRMEVLQLSGYTEDEKLNIAIKYLIPKQLKENGLNENELRITDMAIQDIIRYYTREAGVRNLEREIAKLCRKVVKKILLQKKKSKIKKTEIIDRNDLENYLGVRIFRFGLAENLDRVGEVNGLAWTETGGDLLSIEVAVVPGKGKTVYTGHLGEVMQESIQAALTVVRSRAQHFKLHKDFNEKIDIHVHVPEGATPKDGPSAGIGMCTALASALTGIPVRADVAMTGEITLRGEVLPIGGLKEKLLAALRGGIKTVIIPEENVKDLKELAKNITGNLEIIPVRWIDQVWEIALLASKKDKSKMVKKNAKAKAKSRKK